MIVASQEIVVTITQKPGTGSPSQWSCAVVGWGGAYELLHVVGYMPEVLAALKVAIDRLEKC